MKILAKHKDYYDYLSGIWGEDPKLILDRRKFDPTRIGKGKIKLAICGRLIEGHHDGKRVWYGEDLRQFHQEQKYTSTNAPKYKHVIIREYPEGRFFSSDYYSTEIIETNLNTKLDCPILIINNRYGDNVSKYPLLSQLDLASYIPAEQIYQWLVDWLSAKVDKLQERPDNLSNTQKIENKGFDKITSFRPNIKK